MLHIVSILHKLYWRASSYAICAQQYICIPSEYEFTNLLLFLIFRLLKLFIKYIVYTFFCNSFVRVCELCIKPTVRQMHKTAAYLGRHNHSANFN